MDRELLPDNPWRKAKRFVPPVTDSDPEWRGQSTFSRVEIEQLITDPAIPDDRRTLTAL